jgi:hypothetical protein
MLPPQAVVKNKESSGNLSLKAPLPFSAKLYCAGYDNVNHDIIHAALVLTTSGANDKMPYYVYTLLGEGKG